jgi:hypothetical protein
VDRGGLHRVDAWITDTEELFMRDVIDMAREAGFVLGEPWREALVKRFADLVRADEREETDRLRALCDELLSELYVYRASKYLKDTTEAIRNRGNT